MDRKDERGSSLRNKLVKVYNQTGIISPLLEQDIVLSDFETNLFRLYDNILYSTNFEPICVKNLIEYSKLFQFEISPLEADLLIMIDRGFRDGRHDN